MREACVRGGITPFGERLMPMLIEAYGQKRLGVKPTAKLAAPEEQEITLKSSSGTRAVIDLHAHGSGTAASPLIDGKAVIGMASRQLNPDEVKLVDQRFNVNVLPGERACSRARRGRPAPNQPHQKLRFDQSQVFSGQITNWRASASTDQSKIFRRDDKSEHTTRSRPGARPTISISRLRRRP
jgi:phosphate transport system substrate-binding protein